MLLKHVGHDLAGRFCEDFIVLHSHLWFKYDMCICASTNPDMCRDEEIMVALCIPTSGQALRQEGRAILV